MMLICKQNNVKVRKHKTWIPDTKAVEKFIRTTFRLMFPFGEKMEESEPTDSNGSVREKLLIALDSLTDDREQVSSAFLESLPDLKRTLLRDAKYILESDPAATRLIEVVAVYPGFFAIFCYRIAHLLTGYGVPLVPRMITEFAHRETGIDIHPGAKIGSPFSIDHGTGIVIGETTEIGSNVKLYQGVTLGALSVSKGKASSKRHPTIGDNVILYAGSTILGGETVVGRNSVIGGNVWLTESVAPFSVVYHKSQIVVRDNNDFKEPVNFII